MLTRLAVHNLALIENLELTPCDKLNVLSGETGAGKSIIVDGIMLLLGARYDKTLLRYNTPSGYVEGTFETNEAARALLRDFGWDEDDCLIVTRRFFADGKNEIRINGRAATMGMLRELTATLVDIYGQNEYQTLMRPSEHLRLLDAYVRTQAAGCKEEYARAYAQYKETVAALREIGDGASRAREIDLLRFQIEEIENAHTDENEEDELIARRNVITSYEKVYAALAETVNLLGEREEGSASELTGDAERELSGIAHLKTEYNELYERLQSVAIEISDICDSVRDEWESMQYDPGELDEIEKRLSFVRSLKRKYGAYADMKAFAENAAKRLDFLENADAHFAQLTECKDRLLRTLYDSATAWHAVRAAGAREFARRMKEQLHELGMENADFTVELPELPAFDAFEGTFGALGADTAEFYLSPNAGQPLKPLVKIISGGEMSRFMLALKVITAAADDIPTMIFDEIDAGISGITGQVVAKKLAAISRKHQILCVTHLAQIASMADAHFFISKKTADNDTVTTVVPLDERGMVDEISRLSGGKGISEQSYLSAQTMKKWSNEYKSTL